MLAASIGGLDALVLGAGNGENPALSRQSICERLRWMGITLDTTSGSLLARIAARIFGIGVVWMCREINMIASRPTPRAGSILPGKVRSDEDRCDHPGRDNDPRWLGLQPTPEAYVWRCVVNLPQK